MAYKRFPGGLNFQWGYHYVSGVNPYLKTPRRCFVIQLRRGTWCRTIYKRPEPIQRDPKMATYGVRYQAVTHCGRGWSEHGKALCGYWGGKRVFELFYRKVLS